MAAGGTLYRSCRLGLLIRLIFRERPQLFNSFKAKANSSCLTSSFIRNFSGVTSETTTNSLDSKKTSHESAVKKSKHLWKIRKLCEKNDLSSARELLENFIEHYWSNESLTRTFNCFLYHAVREQNHEVVHYVLDKMKSCKIQKDGATYYILTLYYSENGFLDQGIELLREMQATGVGKTSRNYTPIIVSTARAGKLEVAFKLYEEMRREELPSICCYPALINGVVASSNRGMWDDKVLGMLQNVSAERLQLNMETLESVAEWFRGRTGNKWQSSWTTINSSGICQSCGHTLDSGKLTETEHSILKQHLIQLLWKSLEKQHVKCFTTIGNFIDKQTSDNKDSLPHSLDEYISKTGPYDVVLDALNVGYYCGKGNFDTIKLQVMIKNLLDDDKKVLVVGAPPLSLLDMASSANDGFRCGVFVIKGRCVQDDLYMLLAAMHCGIDTLLVSNDMFQDHLHKLPISIQILLKRCLRTNQVFLTRSHDDSQVLFKTHPSYDPIVQTTCSTWHLPADTDDVWLCARKT